MIVVEPHSAPAPRSLDVGVQRLVGLVEVCLDGSLDERTVASCCEAIGPLLASGTTLDLDCTELVEIDGFGLALLLDVRRRLITEGGALVVRFAQPAVLDRLRGTALDDVLIVAA